MEDVLKCYKVLDLEPGATAEQARKAYVELAHVWHPDRFQANPVLREQARVKMQEIDEAYKTLTGFLPGLRRSDVLEPAEVVDPPKVDDVIEVSDSNASMKYSIVGFLGSDYSQYSGFLSSADFPRPGRPG